jgi:hypothetical protein
MVSKYSNNKEDSKVKKAIGIFVVLVILAVIMTGTVFAQDRSVSVSRNISGSTPYFSNEIPGWVETMLQKSGWKVCPNSTYSLSIETSVTTNSGSGNNSTNVAGYSVSGNSQSYISSGLMTLKLYDTTTKTLVATAFARASKKAGDGYVNVSTPHGNISGGGNHGNVQETLTRDVLLELATVTVTDLSRQNIQVSAPAVSQSVSGSTASTNPSTPTFSSPETKEPDLVLLCNLGAYLELYEYDKGLWKFIGKRRVADKNGVEKVYGLGRGKQINILMKCRKVPCGITRMVTTPDFEVNLRY